MTKNNDLEKHLMPEYDDVTIKSSPIPSNITPTEIRRRQDKHNPPALTEDDKIALKDLIAHMVHLDPIDFDNVFTYLQIMYAAKLENNNYGNYIALTKKRFITPVVTPGTRRYKHTPERIDDLRHLLTNFYPNVDADDFMNAFHKGVNTSN